MVPWFAHSIYFPCWIDATYEGGEIPTRLFDDDQSLSEKEERLKAYKQRFQDKMDHRDETNMEVANSNHNNESWATLDLMAIGAEPMGEIWQRNGADNSVSSADNGEDVV